MSFSFYVARRYLFSKKSTNVINLISGISAVGVALATMAMVVALSVFNGFSDLVGTLFTAFDPQIEITPTMGKTAPADDPLLTYVRDSIKEVDVVTECVEDQALAIYDGRQCMVTIKGVENNFDRQTHIKKILYGPGEYALRGGNGYYYGIMGIRLAERMGMRIDFGENGDTLWIYAPRREGQFLMGDVEQPFEREELYSPKVVFQVLQVKYDDRYILTHIDFARRLFDQQGQVSSLLVRLKQDSNFEAVKAKIKKKLGDRYTVKDRYEQQDDTFRIMAIEKLIAYIFMVFILVVACFNIIGSLSMLIIDKRKDVTTLRNLGANDRQISRIFLFEGWLISALGAIVGILIGLLLCWVQQQFELIKLGNSEGSFIINAYPVSVHPWDVVVVFFTVMVVSFVSVWYPVRYFSRRLL